MTNAEATVRAMYDAFAAKDEPRLRELIDPDVEWNQCDGFPGGAKRRGIDDVLAAVLRGNSATWKGFAARVEEYVASGSRVVVLGRYEGTHSVSGRPMVSVFAHAYEVENGRILRLEQIADTWPMVAAARDLDL